MKSADGGLRRSKLPSTTTQVGSAIRPFMGSFSPRFAKCHHNVITSGFIFTLMSLEQFEHTILRFLDSKSCSAASQPVKAPNQEYRHAQNCMLQSPPRRKGRWDRTRTRLPYCTS